MGDDTIPFRRPRPPRHTAPEFDHAAYNRAALRQELDRRLSSNPVPARITIALDLRSLNGDQVDRDLGVWEPPDGWTGPVWEPGTAVDRWEDGTLVPTREQVIALARLTGMPWRFFYSPVETMPSRVFVCERHHGLTIVRSEVDHNGVLHNFYEPDDWSNDELDEPNPPRRSPGSGRNTRGRIRSNATEPPVRTHRFELDQAVPGVCRHCGLPKVNRQHDDDPGPVSDDSGMPDEMR